MADEQRRYKDVDRLDVSAWTGPASLLEIRISGELDLYTIGKLDRRLHEAWDGLVFSTVVLDLSGVTMFDSTALHALWTIRHELVATGVRLMLRSPSDVVMRILVLTGLKGLFEIEPA